MLKTIAMLIFHNRTSQYNLHYSETNFLCVLKIKRTQFFKFMTPCLLIPPSPVFYWNVMKDFCTMISLVTLNPPPFLWAPLRHLCAASVGSPAPPTLPPNECGEGGEGRGRCLAEHTWLCSRGLQYSGGVIKLLDIQCPYSRVEKEHFKLLLIILSADRRGS